MMKVFLTLALIIVSCSFLLANGKSDKNKVTPEAAKKEQMVVNDTVNISEMVQKQITDAREKEIYRSKFNSEAAILPLIEENTKSIKGLNPLPFLSSVYFSKVFILIYASVFVALIIVIRRIKDKKNNSSQNLKNAINILRNEVVVKKQNKKLEKLRRKINASNQLNNFGEQEIIKTAKKLQISKGELLLGCKNKITSAK